MNSNERHNEWQRETKSDNEWYSKWERMITSGNESQQMAKSNKKWQ